MSAANETLMRRWFDEVWNQGCVETIDELLAPDGVAYGLGGPDLRGPEGFKPFHTQFRGAFPDVKITIDDMFSSGDRVAVRFTCRATHRGDHLGVKATGKPVAFTAMSMVDCREGQIVAGWNLIDMYGMLQQIGVVPPLDRLG